MITESYCLVNPKSFAQLGTYSMKHYHPLLYVINNTHRFLVENFYKNLYLQNTSIYATTEQNN